MAAYVSNSLPASDRVLTHWIPEDPVFWESHGRPIANRNLWLSIPALMLAFAVWMVWSVVVVNLPNIGFKLSTGELFWLAALPALGGATLRIVYSFMVPIFGGRRWTALSTALLLLPAVGIGAAVQDPDTSYATLVVLALMCGFGGGNFASSMANINYFFPNAQKGMALGLNAGLGNLGVSIMQFAVPLVVTGSAFGAFGGAPQTWFSVTGGESRHMWLQNAGYVWVPFIIVSALAAWFGMHDIAGVKTSFAAQARTFKRKHTWLMSWLYLGTFGSFIGYSAAFPLLAQSQFEGANALSYAFFGPLAGALFRPVGGWLSDQVGGASVTFWNFIVMMLAVVGLLLCLPSAPGGGSYAGFLAMFMVLFATSGIGNGSTFRMIPVIFSIEQQRLARGKSGLALEQALKNANSEAAAALGFASAIGAYGGFFIPQSYGSSISLSGGPEAALYGFVVFYLICILVTWWFYARRNAEMPC